MILAIIGDYLLDYKMIGTSSAPNAYMGIEWNVAPDWRYAVSSILGFICAAMFAYAAVELLRVMESKYKVKDSKLYMLFKIANWSGILYFAFIHIGICMLPVVFNAGMEVTADVTASVGMTIRVLNVLLILQKRNKTVKVRSKRSEEKINFFIDNGNKNDYTDIVCTRKRGFFPMGNCAEKFHCVQINI